MALDCQEKTRKIEDRENRMNSSNSENGAGLNRDGVKEIVRCVARMIVYLVVLLICAGWPG
jgi:hypothetical protein